MQQNWKTHITPPRNAMRLNFKEVWAYRDLIGLFIKRDFTAKYKQTILGPLWAVLQPLLTTVVFSVIFGALAGLTTADVPGETPKVPAFLFYMIGTVTWSYFSATVNANAHTFLNNRAVMGKVYFPRIVTPISTALSNLIAFLIQIVLFAVIALICVLTGVAELRLSPYMLLVPLLILQLAMLSTGIGIIISSLTTKYRDLTMLVSFGLHLWQYLSPVPYGLAMIPENKLWLYMLNPVTPIITTMRLAFLGTGYFSWLYYGISLMITVAVFLLGIVMFNRIERTFMDTV